MKKAQRIICLILAIFMCTGFFPVVEAYADTNSKIQLIWPIWKYKNVNGKYVATECQVTTRPARREKGCISTLYGYDSWNGGRYHFAIDICDCADYAVVAAADATVYSAGYNDYVGNYVYLKHTDKYNGKTVYTRYLHMESRPLVSKGDVVQAGDVIGFVGDTGTQASGEHLCFRICAGGLYTGGSLDVASKYASSAEGAIIDAYESAINYKCVDPLGNQVSYSFSLCNHKWGDNGVCTSCQKVSYDYSGSRTYVSGTIVSNGGTVTLKDAPYAAAETLSSSSVYACYDVLATVKNHFGNTWYEIAYGNKTAYVYCENTVPKSGKPYYQVGTGRIQCNDSYKVDGKSYTELPVSIEKGTSVYLSGQLISTEYDITSVTVGIYTRSGTKKYAYTDDSVDSRTFDLADADSSLMFSALSAGNYTLKIIVTTENGVDQVFAGRTQDFAVTSGATATQYKVTLNANGGFFGSDTYSKSQTVSKGNSVALSNYTPTRTGYTLLGWSSSANATSAAYLPSGSYKPSSKITLYAVWQKIEPPAVPSLTQETLDVGVGQEATVNWWSVTGAEQYIVTFYDTEGTACFTANTMATSASTVLNEAGVYTVAVKAVNISGESAESQTATITVHDPATVTFLNYDGSVWSTQTVAYGATATTPADPSRPGYTFAGWDGSLYNVKEDRTITAKYTAIGYDVTFYDYEGNVASTQTVYYNGDVPGSAIAPDASALNIPEGHVLAGWDTDAWQSVTQDNVKVYPCVIWSNEDLPITTEITSVTKAGNGYWVFYTIENNVADAQNGRVVVVLKSGFGKFLTKTESGAFYLDGNSSYSGNLYVPLNDAILDESFATVEAYVVNSYTSLVPISSVAQMSLVENDDSDWSAWMTEEEYAAYSGDKSETQTRTEYSTRTRSVSDWTTNTSYLDWALLDTRTVLSDWSSWSDWSTTEVTADTYTDVETKEVQTAAAYTQYRYGKYVSTTSGTGSDGDYYPSGWGHFHQSYYNGGSYKTSYTAWSRTKVSPTSTNAYYWGTNNAAKTGTLRSGKYYWNKYVVSGNTYYWQQTRTIPATYETQYRYRTCTDVTEYQYYMWNAWSDWSTTAATATEDLEVQTRTMYRVRLPASEAGEGYTISGTISAPGISDLAGRQVILNIYKVDEASDYSNEYIAQSVLGENGEYSFTGIHTYETPSVKTGDFTVTLTIEGSSGPMVIDTGDMFRAPKQTYQVVFVDEITGQQIGETQTVAEGDSVTAPEVPEKEGYMFLGWEYGLTNIRDNMTIAARFVPKTFTVVYVDWNNSTVSMQTDVPYGTALNEIADPPTREGYTFLGWKAEDGGDINRVTRSMIVVAQYDKMSYTVRFLDADGNVVSEQVVEYGEAAELPADGDVTIAEGMYLENWSEDYSCVTGAMDIEPVLLYEADAEYPEASIASGIYEGTQTVELFTQSDNSTISYRLITSDSLVEDVEEVAENSLDGVSEAALMAVSLDGDSADTEETGGSANEQTYSGPISLTQSAVLEVTSHEENANSVTETYEYIIVPEGSRPAAPESLTAEDYSDRIDLSWPAVEGADGYIIYKTDVFGNSERFMTDACTYSDTNVVSITDYTYTVKSFSIYTESDTETYLISDDTSPEVTIRYYGEQYAVEEIEITAPSAVLNGNTIQMTATVSPAGAYDPTITWTVESGTGTATISTDGVFTANSVGTVTVMATANDGSGVVATKEISIIEASTDVVNLSITSAAVREGKSVTISVNISENSDVAALQFAVMYDSNLLTLTEAIEGAVMTDKAPTINTETPGVIMFVWDDLTGLVDGGSLLDMTFDAQSTDESADTILSIPNVGESDEYELVCATSDWTECDVEIINGKISILCLQLGDINGDGKINVLDVSMARRYSAKLLDLNDKQFLAGDVNADGKINVADINLIRKYAAKLITVFPAEE